MKKLLSIVLCLAMVLAMGAVAFAAESETAVAPKIDFTNADNFTKESDDLGVWQENGIKLTVARPRAAAGGSSIQPVAHTWTDHTRFLKGHQVTVEYPNMKSVKFTFIDAKRADYMQQSICQYPGITVTVPEDKLTLTVDFAAPLNSFTIDFLVNIVRVTSVEIVATFQEGETAGTIQGPKTLTVADKTFATVGGRWIYNQAITSANNYLYDMVIYDTKYEGEFTTSSMYTNGVALIVDQEGVLTGMFTSANGAYYNADGEQKNYYASPTKWFQAAFDSLAEGEIMICFHNDGKAGVENYDKAMAELKDPAVYGQKVTLTGFEFSAPACQHTNTKVEGAVEATCTEPGFTGNTVCADCGEQIAVGTEIAALGHAFVDGTCAACGAADPDYVKPVVNLTIGQNPINNEEITYTYTAAADGTLNLSLSISAMAIRDHLNLSYSINGGEAVVLASGRVANVNKDIALNKNDVIEITIETNLQTALVATWTDTPAACQHTNTKVEGAVEATCEEKGYTGNTVCADCGETVAEGTEIAALGHNYVDGVCTNCNNPKTFDVFGIMVAVMAASGTALVCLKKKED